MTLRVAAIAGLALVAVVQAAALPDLLDVDEPLTAGFAKALVAGYCVAVAGACLLAAVLPRRHLGLPLAVAAGFAAACLLATLIVGGEAGSFLAAVAVMAACWQVGQRLLRLLRARRLAAIWPVAWLAGIPPVGLAILFLGRVGLLRWWTVAVPVFVLALLTLRDLPALGRRARAAWRHVGADRLGVAAAATCLLSLGIASIFAAAPEIMFDALYAKAWLPEEWARLGRIEPLREHVVLNVTGFAQLLAVPGHLVDADGVGRYLQLLSAVAAVATVWWACRRSPWAPLAAAALAITPHLFWQSTTAYDDAILVLAALALAVAAIRSLDRDGGAGSFLQGAALGVLAGACVDLKLHMAVLAAGLLGGWLLLRGRDGWLAASAGIGLGGLLSAAPPFVLRWLDLGNPVVPAWNDVFKSEHWPARNEQFGFPFGPDTDLLWPLDTLWSAVADPIELNEAAPVGLMGVLAVLVVVALLTVLDRRRRQREVTVLWCGLVLALVAWYVQLRYLRYLLPVGAVAVMMVTLSLSSVRVSANAARAAIAGLAVMAVLLWPATVAQFWNVPGRDVPWEVAFRQIADREYERMSMPEREIVATFDRVAPPGAMAVSDAHQRMWLSEGRDLTPPWEIEARLEVAGGKPGRRPELERLRRAGVRWALAHDGGILLALPFLHATIVRHGELVAEDAGWRLYRLVERPGAGDGRGERLPSARSSASRGWKEGHDFDRL